MAAGAVAGLMVANNIARLRDGIAAARTAWPALEARGLSLVIEPVTGYAVASGTERPALHGRIDDRDVSVRIVSDAVHFAHTEVVAKPAPGVDAVVGVHPSPGGILGRIRSWLGQDIEIGEPAFDEAFLITGKPESAAKSLLTPRVRERVVQLAGGRLAGFTYEKERARVLLFGVESDAQLLSTAIELAVEAARWSV